MMSMTMTKMIMATNKRTKSLSNHVAFLEFQLLELLKHLLWGCLPLNMVPDEDSDDDDDDGGGGGWLVGWLGGW